MARILVVNPNSSIACSDGITAALAPFRLPGAPEFHVVTLREGPPAIYDWRDWHGVVEPLCRLVEREPADAYVIACASDPGIEAVRATTTRPVFGVFRSAVAIATARAERFGVVAIVDASK
ncbi:MAG TPA: aspartate/glutamate racemase family protein, partial [Acetobacteraceae bacterium]|nr:aspartate/glutamate racemase family protein [Acetobacteraceae bacterium]